MEQLLAENATRAIGVSNYCESCLGCLANASVFPQFNQVEYYLGMGKDNHRVNSIGAQHGMVIQAYSVTGNEWYAASGPSPDIMKGNLTTSIAEQHGKAPIQVALKWLTDASKPICVKTTNPSYMKENLDLFAWSLTAEETARLDAHHVSIPYNPADVCRTTGSPVAAKLDDEDAAGGRAPIDTRIVQWSAAERERAAREDTQGFPEQPHEAGPKPAARRSCQPSRTATLSRQPLHRS
jgi:hypothetical protein